MQEQLLAAALAARLPVVPRDAIELDLCRGGPLCGNQAAEHGPLPVRLEAERRLEPHLALAADHEWTSGADRLTQQPVQVVEPQPAAAVRAERPGAPRAEHRRDRMVVGQARGDETAGR